MKRGDICRERVSDGYVALMLTLFPFFVSGDYTTLSAGKYWLFLLLSGGYIAAMLLLSLGERRAPWRLPQLCAVTYLLLTAVSALLSPYGGVWLGNGRREGVLSVALYVGSFLCLSRHARPKAWYARVLGASVGAYALICLWQMGGGNPFSLYPAGLDYAGAGSAYNGAFLGTMGNAGMTGAWLSLSLPVLAAVAALGGRCWRWLLLPLAAGGLTLALMDISAAMVGVLGAAVLSLPVLAGKKNRAGSVCAAALVIGLSLAAVYVLPLPGAAGELHALLHGRVEDSFGSGRIGIWRQLLAVVPRQWAFGSGPDTVGLLGLTPFVGTDAAGGTVIRAVDAAHNEYLQMLVCQGLFALMAYMALLFSALRLWCRAEDRGTRALGCGVLGYALQAFFGIGMCIVSPLFWLALGLLCAPGQREERGGNRMLQAKNGVLTLGAEEMDYVRFGAGEKTLIILPGLGDGLRTVKGTALPTALLYRRFAGDYTVYMLSRKRAVPEGRTTADMARDVREAMDALGIDRADVLGVSMGGMIAQHLAADCPHRVGKLVLVVTAARPNHILRESVAEWVALAKDGDHAALMESNLRRMYSASYFRKNRWMIPLVGRLTKPRSYRRFFRQAEACLTHDAFAKLSRITAKTLVIGGGRDAALGVEPSRELAAGITGAKLRIYERLGHALYDEAKDFQPTVLAFLREE